MPAFPKPKFPYTVNVAQEIPRLRAHKKNRKIPATTQGKLLIATWNIANFGQQQRRDEDHTLIAEILSWFDLIAVQEVKDNFAPLEDVVRTMGSPYKYLMSDVAGNDERLVFIYDSKKLQLLEKVGEIAVPPSDYRHIKIDGIKQKHDGFDRNPYLAAFKKGDFTFVLVNVHLYFGSNKQTQLDRRALETFAVARWAWLRQKSEFSFTRHVIALGDFNMPAAQPGDAIYDALTSKGLVVPHHSSQIGSSIASDKHYDQVAFFSGETEAKFTGQSGVFDFDTVIFPDLWQSRGRGDFNAYLRYYLSDHRLMWIQFQP